MAFTRKMLKDLGIEGEAIDKIIEEHRGTVDSLKDELDNLRSEAETIKALKKEIEELKASADGKSAAEEELSKVKEELSKVKAEFEKFKADSESEKVTAKKSDAYRKALKDAGVSEKRIESVLKLAKVDGLVDALEFEGDEVKDAKKIAETIKSNYAEYIESVKQVGSDVSNPPVHGNPNTFNDMSLADKMAYANANPNDASVQSWLKGE